MHKLLHCLSFVLLGISCASPQKLVEGSTLVQQSNHIDYYLSYPEGYADNTTDNYGLLLFLHGGGDAGKGLTQMKQDGPPKMMAEGYPFPFLVLAPQHPHKRRFWDVHALKQLLDTVVAQNRVDPKRIYLTGLSRGGSAAWDMAVQYPDTFAALAVVCGMAPLPYAHWLNKAMPIWVFHGAADPVIPVAESDQMVSKLKQLGYLVQYNRYQEVGHNAWEKAYARDDLYQWMAQQKIE